MSYSITQPAQNDPVIEFYTTDIFVYISECGLPCQGDPLWTCGGTNRLQVFGPPPGAPAVGHNVLTKCLPWCYTADVDSTKVRFFSVR